MFGSTSLEVATGLIFIFLLLSSLVTALGEIIANALNSRAKCLWQGVAALLEDSADPAKTQAPWTTKLYAHPIMRPLFPLAAQGQESTLGPKGKGPSYLPANSFAAALLEITGVTNPAVNDWQRKLQARLAVVSGGDGSAAAVRQVVEALGNEMATGLDGARLKADLEAVAAHWPAGTDPGVGVRLSVIADQIPAGGLSFVQGPLRELAKNSSPSELAEIIRQIPTAEPESAVMRDGLLALLPQLQADPAALATAKTFADGMAGQQARRALARLDNRDLRGALLTLFTQAQGDIQKFETNIQDWFDQSMDRVQGWYKRKNIWVNLVTAALLTILMNVDALVVLRHLCADPALRQSLLSQAQSDEANRPVPLSAPSEPAGAAPLPGAALNQAAGNFSSLRGQLLDLGLPIGWNTAVAPPAGPAAELRPADNLFSEYRALPDWQGLFGLQSGEWVRLGLTLRFHFFGWLITVIAASLGAPFWFDLLNKFMNVRAAGKPPKRRATPKLSV